MAAARASEARVARPGTASVDRRLAFAAAGDSAAPRPVRHRDRIHHESCKREPARPSHGPRPGLMAGLSRGGLVGAGGRADPPDGPKVVGNAPILGRGF